MNPLIIQAFFGFFFLILIAFIISEHKKNINWRLITIVFLMLNIMFLLVHYVHPVAYFIKIVSGCLVKMLDYAQQGAAFVFGNLSNQKSLGFVFAIVVVPTLIFFSSVISILYFYGIMQKTITVLAFLLRKVIKLSAVESLVIISDIFLGQSEGPLVIGPYIKFMTRSQLACAFVAGLSNIAGSVLGMYVVFVAGNDPIARITFANYLLTATFMNAFAAIIFAKIIFPETEAIDYNKTIKIEAHGISSSIIDTIVTGAMTGVKVGIALVTVLIAIIALVHLIDGMFFYLGKLIHLNAIIASSTNNTFSGLSLEYIFGQIFRIFAFFMGIAWHETVAVGSLLGQKIVINELVAYISLGQMKFAGALSPNAVFISTFALASFANFSSIGISMGVFSILAPEKRQEISSFAFKALAGAIMAGFMTATVAGFWHNIFKI